MAEPSFYRCAACRHRWSRMEWKMRKNPPPVCPSCSSLEYEVDEENERAYYRPMGEVVVAVIKDVLNKKHS